MVYCVHGNVLFLLSHFVLKFKIFKNFTKKKKRIHWSPGFVAVLEEFSPWLDWNQKMFSQPLKKQLKGKL